MELEETVEVMKAYTLVSQNTSSLLAEAIFTKQYSRKPCPVISDAGMENKWENGDNTENVVTELLTTELEIPKERSPRT